jgi:hypothetical protein
LGSWNITSWNNRDQEIIMELSTHRIDICNLSETRMKGKGNSRYQNYILFYSGKSKNQRAHAGIHGKFENHIDNVEYVDHNTMYVTLKFNSERIHAISIYAPDINKPREEREYFFESLHETLNQLPKEDKIFVMGDLNARIGNTPIPGIMQR